MGWSAPKSFGTEILASADMNTYVSDNLTYLQNGRSKGIYVFTGNYTTTSASFTNVDGTNISFSITTVADNSLIWLGLVASVYISAAGTVTYTWTVGGTNVGDSSAGVLVVYSSGVSTPADCSHSFPYLVATAGTYACNLQWKTSTGTATMQGIGGRAYAKEIG